MRDNHDGAHELALTIINTGSGYALRSETGECGWNSDNPAVKRVCAKIWIEIANDGAARYERDFGYRGASCFTVADILGAAQELAEYYEQHARETIALRTAEASR